MEPASFAEDGILAALIQDFDQDETKDLLILRTEKEQVSEFAPADDEYGYYQGTETLTTQSHYKAELYKVQEAEVILTAEAEFTLESMDLVKQGIAGYGSFLEALDDGQYDQTIRISVKDQQIGIIHSHGAKPPVVQNVLIEVSADALNVSDQPLDEGELLFEETIQKGGEGLEMTVTDAWTEAEKEESAYTWSKTKIDQTEAFLSYYEEVFGPVTEEEKKQYFDFFAEALKVESAKEDTKAVNEALKVLVPDFLTDEERLKELAEEGYLWHQKLTGVRLDEKSISVDASYAGGWYATDSGIAGDNLYTLDLKTGSEALVTELMKVTQEQAADMIMEALDEQYGSSRGWTEVTSGLEMEPWRVSAETYVKEMLSSGMGAYVDSNGEVYVAVQVAGPFAEYTLPCGLGAVKE